MCATLFLFLRFYFFSFSLHFRSVFIKSYTITHVRVKHRIRTKPPHARCTIVIIACVRMHDITSYNPNECYEPTQGTQLHTKCRNKNRNVTDSNKKYSKRNEMIPIGMCQYFGDWPKGGASVRMRKIQLEWKSCPENFRLGFDFSTELQIIVWVSV